MCKNGQCHAECKATRDCEAPALCVVVEGASVCQLPGDRACRAGKCKAPFACAPDDICRGKCTYPGDCVAGQTCTASFCVDIDFTDGAVPQKKDASADVSERPLDGPWAVDSRLALDGEPADTRSVLDGEPDTPQIVDAGASVSRDVVDASERDRPAPRLDTGLAAADVSARDVAPPPVVTCGNGKVEVELGETCDKGITAGPGACPTSCNDGDSCTIASLVGRADQCTAACSKQSITACNRVEDGCCPVNCNANNDSDCEPFCGNAVVEPNEECDWGISTGLGVCPETCDDHDVCTSDTKSGSRDLCSVICSHEQITACTSGDGCCPDDCSSGNDLDCPPGCGNGVVDDGETCDRNITTGSGVCPMTCNDGIACTRDTLEGSINQCSAACRYPAITACNRVEDGCCPVNCNANNDSDCVPVCGNGVLESSEACDRGITTGPGVCPTTCDDGKACTIDTLSGSDLECTTTCSNLPITACASGDGCCAPGCNANNDTECTAECGNAVVEPGETCDKRIDGSCPSACDDGNACTENRLTGAADDCSAECSYPAITSCSHGDGCCPSGCNRSTDDDCAGCLSNEECPAGTVCSDYACVPCTETWTATGGGNHCNNNWSPANGTTVGGTHTNVRTFSVISGRTIHVTTTNSAGNGLTVEATDVSVAGIIDASAAGGEGGDGGSGRTSGEQYYCGGFGHDGVAGKGSYPGGAGSGGDGMASNDGNQAGCCGHNGGSGTGGLRGGYMAVRTNGDSTTNMSVVPGSGGGGGGGGGAGSRCGSNSNYPAGTGGGGGGGGRGGGYVALTARRNVVVAGTISANGVLGGNGSNGSKAVAGTECRYSSPAGGPGGSGKTSGGGTGGQGAKADVPCPSGSGSGVTNTIGGNGGPGGGGAGGGILLSGNSVDFASATLTTLGGGSSAANGGTIKVFSCTLSAGATSKSGRYYAAQASFCP